MGGSANVSNSLKKYTRVEGFKRVLHLLELRLSSICYHSDKTDACIFIAGWSIEF